jgi:hypothetical protein
MAILKNQDTQKLLYLRSLHIFGRNPFKSDTALHNSDASQIHASIRWECNAWVLIDHSRNGCFVDGKRAASNVKIALAPGMRIQFGAGSDVFWMVESLDPPCPMLLPQDDSDAAIKLQRFHFLPSEDEPESTVYLSANGQWTLESGSGSKVLQDGDLIQIGNYSWKFFGSPEIAATSDFPGLRLTPSDPAMFKFIASQNEEHISLCLIDGERSADLGERTHHYSLLTLARLRLGDAARGFDPSSQGWIEVERLARMLGIDVAHLNIQIFRARSQIARALPGGSDVSGVIERRRGEIRFGAFRFQIVHGSQVEATFEPPVTPSMVSAVNSNTSQVSQMTH